MTEAAMASQENDRRYHDRPAPRQVTLFKGLALDNIEEVENPIKQLNHFPPRRNFYQSKVVNQERKTPNCSLTIGMPTLIRPGKCQPSGCTKHNVGEIDNLRTAVRKDSIRIP